MNRDNIMNTKLFYKLAISAAFVALPGFGLTEVSVSAASSDKSAALQAKKAHAFALKAEKQLAKGKVDKALSYAEAAVAGDLRNTEYRALLARIYMKQGRFVATERTLMDVMELGQVDPRTVVSLALARIAQGKVDSAISLVDANRAILPASDYGLALALAGDQKRAIEVLVDAIRSDNATARTRQNLALAYAFDGRWREAQVMAVQDMPKTVVDQRIVEWAQYTRPGAYEVRVAGLLGVNAQRDDAGQPVRLALNAVPADTQMAEAAPAVETSVAMAELPAVAPAPVTELAAVGPAPVEFAPAVEEATDAAVAVAVAVAPAFDAPLIKAPEAPVKSAAPKASAPKAAAPVKMALADTTSAVSNKSVAGTHLVQLGAFSSSANAQAAWSKTVAKHKILQDFNSASSTVTVNGKKLVRLAATGFGNKATADAACRAIKSGGGDCIVRSLGGEPAAAPVRMAARKPVRVASR
jgi:D-alanyl-D-alanine carboxypeptidase